MLVSNYSTIDHAVIEGRIKSMTNGPILGKCRAEKVLASSTPRTADMLPIASIRTAAAAHLSSRSYS